MARARKVFGSLDSPATLKVLACLFENEIDFEFVPVDLDVGEHKTKTFLSMNPFGQVPVYEDEGVMRFESRAIIRSTSHQYARKGHELIYWDPRMQAVVANWVDVEDHMFEPSARTLIAELAAHKGALDPDTVLVAQADAEAKLARVLDVYEAQLSKSKYLATDKYTIADLLHLPNLQGLVATSAKEMIESRPRVKEWCYEILARPAWAKVLDMKKKALAFQGPLIELSMKAYFM